MSKSNPLKVLVVLLTKFCLYSRTVRALSLNEINVFSFSSPLSWVSVLRACTFSGPYWKAIKMGGKKHFWHLRDSTPTPLHTRKYHKREKLHFYIKITKATVIITPYIFWSILENYNKKEKKSYWHFIIKIIWATVITQSLPKKYIKICFFVVTNCRYDHYINNKHSLCWNF